MPSSASHGAGVLHGGTDHAVQRLDMGARGDLRHNTAEDNVLLNLAEHYVGEDGAAPVRLPPHDRSRRLVAARLDAEHGEGAFGLHCSSASQGLRLRCEPEGS